MRTYTLHFDDDGIGVDKRIEFDAANPALAFALLAADRPRWQAAFWAGNEPISTLRRDPDGVWHLERLAEHNEVKSAACLLASDDGAPLLRSAV